MIPAFENMYMDPVFLKTLKTCAVSLTRPSYSYMPSSLRNHCDYAQNSVEEEY